MAQRVLPVVALVVFFCQAGMARAQLNPEELKNFNLLLTEPDSKASYEKRLKLIGDAMDRERDTKQLAGSMFPIDLKRARIPAEDGIPFLLKRIDHPSEVGKRTVLRMLGAYGVEGKASVPVVLDLVKTEKNRNVHLDAMTTLAKLSPTDAESAAAILDKLGMDEKDYLTNRTALLALSGMATVIPKSAIPNIAKFQQQPQTELGVFAYELIGRIHALERPTLEQLRTMPKIEWRDSADQGYAALSVIGDAGNKAEFAIPLVLGVLESMPPPYLECAAIDTLGRIRSGNPTVINALLERTAASTPLVRSKASMAFQAVDLKEPASVRALAAGLRHKDPAVRLTVAHALRRWDEPGNLTPAGRAEMRTPLFDTIAELNDTVSTAHLDTYLALLRRYGTQAAPVAEPLLKMYQSEAYFKKIGADGVHLRGKRLATLANIGVPESGRALVLDVLRKGPGDPVDGGFAYAAAARAVATFEPSKDAVPLLMTGLENKGKDRDFQFIDWSGDAYKLTNVRLETTRALGKFGPLADEALPILRAMVEGPAEGNLTVQQEARRAYESISGMRLPYAKGVFADGKKEMLHLDERLQVKMVLKVRNPRPQDVLKRLQEATKLTFTMDENVDPDVPVWSFMSSVQTPAWAAMRQMASAPSIQGKWEDVGDGYRLVAMKKSPDAKTAKGPFPRFRDDSNDPLPDDVRLQKSLTIKLNQPKIHEILQVIQAATGVPLAIENVDTESPIFGSISWSNTAAWSILRTVAESPRIDGAWVKVGDGYLLRGTVPPQPVVVRPVVPAVVATPVTVSAGPGASISILLGIGLFLTLAVGTTLVLLLRTSERQPTAPPFRQ